MPQLNFGTFPVAFIITLISFVISYRIFLYFYLNPYFLLKKTRSDIINKINQEILNFGKKIKKLQIEINSIENELDTKIKAEKELFEIEIKDYNLKKNTETDEIMKKIKDDYLSSLEKEKEKFIFNFQKDKNIIIDAISSKIKYNFIQEENLDKLEKKYE